ncbi:cation:proton antiporter [Actinorhabdospora filicis]|uniref:Cation:proton antiporter n=1 Tax=Actinorhabdospora filicis TaxID=1785913 RepID=A0A9W6WB26_9ACTN|nr:cation:proton antiporter [Actinorhabdospora filicis]GLZ78275.1 cation:proton antiporter [Actinorhabdospora filicis]
MAHDSALILLALAVILVACKIMHLVCRAIGQPAVIGEMAAGVLLGPSLFAALAPGVHAHLFTDDVKSAVGTMSQIGLVLFMFTVGLEFSTGQIRSGVKVGFAVSLTGMAVPLGLGVGFAFLLAGPVDLFPDGVSVPVGALFLGLLLAITAFPVMARIITDRGIGGTRYGTVSLAAGALDDIAAWSLMALVLALAGTAGPGEIWLTLGGLALLIAAAIPGRHLLRRALESRRVQAADDLVLAVIVLLLIAWFTSMIGLHAVIGAFALGVLMPRNERTARLAELIRPLTVGLLVPLFFVSSGLRTDFRVLDSPVILLAGAALVVLAFAGKLVACSLTARLLHEGWADSLRIGLLMNTRGLMQLVALNVGLQAGLVTPTLFAMVVIVALVTTLCASPGLALIDRLRRRADLRAPVPLLERAPDSDGLPRK